MNKKTVTRQASNLSGATRVFKIATTIDIQSTGDYQDSSQQAWDSLVTVISMRAQPVLLTEPEAATFSSMSDVTLSGSGFVFEFVSEHHEAFATHDEDFNVVDPVGMLKILLEDVMLNDTTVQIGTNLEIISTGKY